MKKIIFVAIALMYGCSNTVIPGNVIETNNNAISSDDKAYCVAPYASVGNSVSLPDGSLARIKSLSRESSKCKDPDTPVYALVYIPVKHRTDSTQLGVPAPVGTRIK